MKVWNWIFLVVAVVCGWIALAELPIVWPYDFFAVLFCILIGAKAAWPLIPATKKTKITQTPPELTGEERIRRFLARRNRDAIIYALLFLVVVALGFLSLWPLSNFLGLFSFLLFIASAIGAYFLGSLLIRALGDVGKWWFLVPENHAGYIELFGACKVVIICVNDPRFRPHYQDLVKKRNGQGGVTWVLLPKGRGLYFMGFTAWPWNYKPKAPWYSRSSDVVNPKVEPNRYLSLKELALDLLSENKGGTVPDVGTADPVDVHANLYLRVQVMDPYLAAYGPDHVMGSLEASILARWRGVVAKLHYYLSGKDGKDDEFEINPEVQTMAHRALVIDLGLCIARQVPNKELDEYPLMRIVPKLEDEELEIFDDFESIVDESQLPKNFRKHSIAWVIRHSFGYLLLDVEVTDLEPVEEVYKELQAKTTAKAKGAAEFQRARGERKAIEEIAAGEAQAIKLKRVEVVAPGGKLILLTNLAGEASKNIDKIVLTGGTGDVAQITTLIQALLKEDGGNGAAVGAGSQTQETAGGES